MFKTKEEFKYEFSKRIIETYGRTVEESHLTEKFLVLELMVRDYASVNWATSKALIRNNYQKQMHYFSMEFLIGRLLVNNMMNLGIYDIAKDGLAEYGINIHDLEELESDAGLGNGGLGRLAACFMDSLASLAYPGHGHTIRYEFGLFKQKIENGYQLELPDQWMQTGFNWEVRKPKHRVPVKFFGKIVYNETTGKYEHVDAEEVYAVPYDVPIIGNKTTTTNTLRLWEAEASDNIPANQNFRQYIQNVRDICQMLYPDDSTPAGKMLRLKQEYFFTCAGLNSIVKAHLRVYPSLNNFHEKNVIQLNDTHPVLAIPELMRILIDEQGYEWDEAWDITTQTFAYTNHTILAEALETWPIDLMQSLLPRVYQIIEEINRRFIGYVKNASDYDEDLLNRVMIIKDGQVHMAHLAIAGSFSVNGVARLHTQILMEQEMKDFNFLYPNKFNNKTNGITFRRWLLHCNHELTRWIGKYVDGFQKGADKLEGLLKYADDAAVLDELLEVKHEKKKQLSAYLKETQGLEINPDSIFDIQIKRLHEYKRQQMNALYIIHKYLEIKGGKKPARPITFIFGAKAAPAYVIAQDIIHLLLVLEEIVNNDPEVSPYMTVLMVENYNVSYAEKLIPACDISEQISLASKEASGTGNMKFMLNGAVTLGTSDGANVEIHELVGDDNIYIFGEKSETVIAHYEKADYVSKDYYKKSPVVKEAVDFIVGKQALKAGHKENLERLYKELIGKDWFMTLLDLEDYIKAKDQALADYEDREKWKKMMLVNIAKAGFFSSDRTIMEYNRDIWKLK